jgi:PKD repeat protein
MHMGTETRKRKVAAVVLAAGLAAGIGVGCSVDEPRPTMTGPSEFALSIGMLASPDQLPRDGSSESVVTVTVRNESGQAVAGQRLAVTANVGSLSATEVVTGENGQASFTFVAPTTSASGGVNNASLSITPIGGTTRTNFPRTLVIPLTGTSGVTSATVPTASFTFAPSAPTRNDTVTFDASASTDEGTTCLDRCTYTWNFGGEATGSGRIATHRFQDVRTYAVTLTVTDAAGTTGTTTQNVVVTAGTAPTASITFSPSSPGIFEPVNFTSEASRVGQAGRTLASHIWQFGDGTNATGLRVSKSYNTTGTYTVTLTVTDNVGAQGTATTSVTVVTGVTAAFDVSNPTDTSFTVYFNAEKSLGSTTGFGSRNVITKYIWHFGDSNEEEETATPRISHTFGAATAYTVTLTVEDSAGRRATTSTSITVAF